MRKRFNAAEKTLIDATGPRGQIEWQNVTVWHRGLLVAGITRDEGGWETVTVDNQEPTARLSAGPIRVGPGHLRAPQS